MNYLFTLLLQAFEGAMTDVLTSQVIDSKMRLINVDVRQRGTLITEMTGIAHKIEWAGRELNTSVQDHFNTYSIAVNTICESFKHNATYIQSFIK